MSRAKLLPLIGTGAALALIAVSYSCTPRATYDPRPIIPPSPDSVLTSGPDPVPTHGWTRRRRAKGCGSNCKVEVWIGAYASARTADTANPPRAPLKIARVINTGAFETEMYALKGHTQYDLLFQRNATTGRAEFVFEPITRLIGERKRRGGVNACRGHKPGPRSDADFRSCDDAPPRMTEASMVGAVPAGLFRALVAEGGGYASEDPAWFSCTSGCCTAMAVY